ncbi:MAG: hypothetical protein ACRECQ_12455, partial [Burkholderiaceae bacterium]
MKGLKWTAIGLAALLVLVVAVAAWTVNTEAGTRWASGIAVDALGDKLEIGAIDGTIAGPLRLTGVRYHDPAAGIDFAAERISIDMALAALFRTAVHVEDAELSGIQVALSEGSQPEPPPEQQQPFSLQPPIDVLIDSLTVNDAVIRRDGELLFELTRALFAGHWTAADLAVERLDVQSPQGEIHFAGRVGHEDVYVGEGNGRFRWTAGERTFAGTLRTAAEDQQATLEMRLTSPVTARLDLGLEQSEMLPWRFALEVPRFDPREGLMPDTSLQSLAASLSGEGSLTAGEVSGQLLINGEPLHLSTLRFERGEDELDIETVLRIGAATG